MRGGVRGRFRLTDLAFQFQQVIDAFRLDYSCYAWSLRTYLYFRWFLLKPPLPALRCIMVRFLAVFVLIFIFGGFY